MNFFRNIRNYNYNPSNALIDRHRARLVQSKSIEIMSLRHTYVHSVITSGLL